MKNLGHFLVRHPVYHDVAELHLVPQRMQAVYQVAVSVARVVHGPMDADLQDDIDAIDAMIDKYDEGYNIVYGVRM